MCLCLDVFDMYRRGRETHGGGKGLKDRYLILIFELYRKERKSRVCVVWIGVCG